MRVALILLVALVALPATGFARDLPQFADLIEEKSPAVVKITTRGTLSRDSRQPRLPEGLDIPPELFRFFPQPPDRNIGGMGSGFIFSEDGYVITNNHVVEGMDTILVRLIDRREFEAEIVGTDPRSDLALLKIDAEDLPYLRFADSDELRVGEWVFAIGSPFGMDFSASQGIVSSIGRSIVNESNENYVPFIQTDVAINPGNSGGPLFNLDGDVVGINSQIYTRSGGYMGLSFAVPSNLAVDVINQLRTKGRVDRGWLGVEIRDLDKDMAQALGLRKPQGALVNRLFEGGPADQAGLKSGDVILEFDGETIEESGDLPHVVGVTPPGKTVNVIVMRERERRTLEVEVGTLERGDDTPQRASRDDQPEPGDVDRLGVAVEPLDDATREGLDVEGGVRVVRVDGDSPAAKAGLEQGDVIVQLGFNQVTDVEAYRNLVANLPPDTLLPIRFFRGDQAVFRTFTLAE